MPEDDLVRFARGQVTLSEWNRLYAVIRKHPGSQEHVQELLRGIPDDTERRRALELHETLREHYERLVRTFGESLSHKKRPRQGGKR